MGYGGAKLGAWVVSSAFSRHPGRGWPGLGNQGWPLAEHSAVCPPVIEVASGEYGDLNPMLFRAVQKGLCAMTEKKSSLEKNEVSAPCPPCRPVSRVKRADSAGWGRGAGT